MAFSVYSILMFGGSGMLSVSVAAVPCGLDGGGARAGVRVGRWCPTVLKCCYASCVVDADGQAEQRTFGSSGMDVSEHT